MTNSSRLDKNRNGDDGKSSFDGFIKGTVVGTYGRFSNNCFLFTALYLTDFYLTAFYLTQRESLYGFWHLLDLVLNLYEYE